MACGLCSTLPAGTKCPICGPAPLVWTAPSKGRKSRTQAPRQTAPAVPASVSRPLIRQPLAQAVPLPPTPKPVLPAIVAPPPPAAPASVAWTEIAPANRAIVVEKIRSTFKAGDVLKGVYQVCLIANRDQFQGRKLELVEMDERARFAGHVSPTDDRRRWQIFDAAIKELGFDPRQDDTPKDAARTEISGADLVAELLNG